ncbi:Protein MAM3 [Penicillium oxalicum]|uniref:Protein MAM3 n=1 Tax=Penicillium oxalicum TaxID=69781 RepID=UPI0020B8D1CE|nr:Protein MAM3 [Penicillium oxalicum]KAI2794339.1 Protein MAM3 [Penicillium oxalicum]
MAARATHLLAARPIVLSLVKFIFFAFSHLPLATAAPVLSPYLHSLNHDVEPPKDADDPSLWLYLSISAALVLSGGAFAGLTIALMGQDEVYLQVIQTSGEGSEKKNAASVLNLLKKGKHWVLVTLLLSNVITNETLPIVLDRTLGGGWPAVLGSTALIVIFGEIVPQSICVRYGLPIGAWMAPCVLVLMYIMSPVAWPVAKLLDKLLGEDHGTIYKKAGLKTLVTLHKTMGEAGEQLNSDEVTIISAVLDLKEKSVGTIMTPMEDVFTMSADTVLDERTMDLILSQGYSRIPIHAPDNPMNFVGMLLVKMLITYDPEDCKRVREFALATLPETRPETSCLDIVNFFQEGKSHMVLVSEYPGEDRGALGVVTLEDVIEELIGEEIIDESDVFIDVHKAIRRMAPAPKSRVPKGKIVEDPPMMPVQTDEQADGTDGNDENSKSSPGADKTLLELSRRRSSVEAPPPRFHLRRQAPDQSADPTDNWVTHRGATDEIREHLKHLGPSNLASRPRQTRYSSVKIKRSGTSPPRAAHTDAESNHNISESEPLLASNGLQGGIGAGLVSSGADAKDGALAVKMGYGAISAQDQVTKATNAQQYKDLPEVAIPEEDSEEDENVAQAPISRKSTSKNSSTSMSISSADSKSNDYVIHRGPTRSGSITEQIVDMNGIRKVVLHANGNSSSESEPGSSPQPTGNSTPIRNDKATETLIPEESQPSVHESQHKKRRRKKKRGKNHKTAGDDNATEDQPLLQ